MTINNLGDAKHPIWALARLLILMVTLSFVLWLNASHFDETELRSIIWVFLAAAGVEGGVQTLTRLMGDKGGKS